MNENDFSMFSEFKEVAETIKNNKDKDESSLPAMIILERKEWGENKHAMCGGVDNLITLYEWGLNILCEGYEIEFDDILKLIKLKHKETKHIHISDIKKNINEV